VSDSSPVDTALSSPPTPLPPRRTEGASNRHRTPRCSNCPHRQFAKKRARSARASAVLSGCGWCEEALVREASRANGNGFRRLVTPRSGIQNPDAIGNPHIDRALRRRELSGQGLPAAGMMQRGPLRPHLSAPGGTRTPRRRVRLPAVIAGQDVAAREGIASTRGSEPQGSAGAADADGLHLRGIDATTGQVDERALSEVPDPRGDAPMSTQQRQVCREVPLRFQLDRKVLPSHFVAPRGADAAHTARRLHLTRDRQVREAVRTTRLSSVGHSSCRRCSSPRPESAGGSP
jgi:hypothetical protein